MTEQNSPNQQPTAPKPRWQPLSSIDRRVAGVLAEKAKTTPDAYPLSLNAVCSGCNQKSNRSPIMQLEPDVVEESLDRLREMGAVGIVQGIGRVSKYRHYLYEWLGVDKFEMAVITELLLRGDQTEGELRARAARMEPIAGLNELRPILDSLKSKGLLASLTPEGRGHVVTHALYKPSEMERLKERYTHGFSEGGTADREESPAQPTRHATAAAASSSVNNDVVELLRNELAELRNQIAKLRGELNDVSDQLGRTRSQLQDLKDALGA